VKSSAYAAVLLMHNSLRYNVFKLIEKGESNDKAIGNKPKQRKHINDQRTSRYVG
jgi:hypothetical protein